jgi:5'(3')-deoxyribonucleotidase
VKKSVGIDCDGVMADWAKSALIAAEILRKAGIVIPQANLRKYDLGLDGAERDAFWEAIGQTGFCRDLDPYPQALEAFPRLLAIADVYVVTSYLHTGKTWVYERDVWLRQHFGLENDNTIHAHAKFLVGVDVFVDDKPEHVESWASNPRNSLGVPVLWTQPYNEGHKFSPGVDYRVVRTNAWNYLIELVSSL